jgi:hypothetical protein
MLKFDSSVPVYVDMFGGCRQANRVFKNEPAKFREFR